MENFQILVADCPFSFTDRLKMTDVKRGSHANYNTMSMEEIKKLPISQIADPQGAILCFWVPSSMLQEGLDIMKTWGFKPKQSYIWVKVKKYRFQRFIKWLKKHILKHPQVCYDQLAYERAINSVIDAVPSLDMNEELAFGMGRLFRQTHEICLIGINNNNIYKNLQNKSQRSVSFAENLKHSSKPEYLQDSLDIMFNDKNLNKVEIFARRQRKGWFCLGNEAPMTYGEDIYVSLNKLIYMSDNILLNINKVIKAYSDKKQQKLFTLWQNLLESSSDVQKDTITE